MALALALAILPAALVPVPPASAAPIERALGETIYVPAYSRISIDAGRVQPLASTLVVHNVDPNTTIEILTVRYHDENGRLLNTLMADPRPLAPFASANFLIAIRDTSGGTGANFIVEWRSESPAIVPDVEAIIVGGTGTTGISFSTRGRAIARTTPTAD